MKKLNYYKNNTEVLNDFGVVEGTVRNWIIKAKEYGIELTIANNKLKIVRSDKNKEILQELSIRSKKYKPNEDKLVIKIKRKQLKFLSENQIISIISNLKTRKEINLKYSYMENGADLWSQFYNEALADTKYDPCISDFQFLKQNYSFLKDFFGKYKKINVVDIGPGNSQQSIPLLEQFEKDGFLNSYTAIDISQKMLEISKKNVEEHLPELKTNYVKLDLETHSLQDTLYKIKRENKEKYPTLILFISGTVGSFENRNFVSFNIKEGMLEDDMIIFSNVFDNQSNTNLFPHSTALPKGYEFLTWFRRHLGFTDESVEDCASFNERTGFKEFGFKATKDILVTIPDYDESFYIYKSQIITTWKHKKDDWDTIYQLARDMDMEMRLVVRHPVHDNIMYMLTKPARIG